LSMKCPFCGNDEDKVIDSRPAEEGLAIRRRRECISCNSRFTTYEKIENLPLVVIKKDGTRQPFDSGKLISGLLKACEKRPVSIDQIESLVHSIEDQVQSSLKREISSGEIGEMVMERLKKLDEVAYVRFASVYRQFKDVNSFFQELSAMLDKRE
jgi:transcriptional repressor NrdR